VTESERHEIKAKLIEFGFWGVGEEGDPTSDYDDALKVQDRAESKLAKYTFLVSITVTHRPPTYYAMVMSSERGHALAIADTYPESICLAALALLNPISSLTGYRSSAAQSGCRFKNHGNDSGPNSPLL
jgi:hypothetical protein